MRDDKWATLWGKWWSSLTANDRYDFDSEGRGYKKDSGHMMHLAFDAGIESQAAEIAKLRADAVRNHEDYVTQNKCIADQHDRIAKLTAEHDALLAVVVAASNAMHGRSGEAYQEQSYNKALQLLDAARTQEKQDE